MIQYNLHGVHCEKCAEELEEKLNRTQKRKAIAIQYPKQVMEIEDETQVDFEIMNKILEFEKVTLDKFDEKKQSTKNELDSHSHDHSSSFETDATQKITIVFFLNLFFSIIEFVFGILFNSMSILSDAVHDLGDALSIGLAGLFQKMSTKEANDQYSFGHQRFSLLGSLFTAIVLLIGSIIIIYHSVPRLFDAEVVNSQGMFWLSIFAIAANGFSFWLTSRGKSYNESMINLHMLEDLLGWVGVLIVSIILRFTDWYFLDPLLSIGIAGFILYKTWPVFKETVEIFLEATPQNIQIDEVKESILSLDGVTNLSHLHIWSIDGNEHAMTVTISTSAHDSYLNNEIKRKIRDLISGYDISHSTIEIVFDPDGIVSK